MNTGQIRFFIHIYQYHFLRISLLDEQMIDRFVIWRDEYLGGNIAKENIVSDEVLELQEEVTGFKWIVYGEKERNRLLKAGASEEMIFELYDMPARIKNSIFEIKAYRYLLEMYKIEHPTKMGGIERLIKRSFNILMPVTGRKIDELKGALKRKRYSRDLFRILTRFDKRFAFCGSNDVLLELDRMLTGINYSKYVGVFWNGEEVEKKDELISSAEIDDYELVFFCFDKNNFRKTEEYLLDNEISRANVQIVGDIVSFHGSGSAAFNVYDWLIGDAREMPNQMTGIFTFSNDEPSSSDDELEPFQILLLGGSTTDPTTANIKCWGECLFDALSKMNIPCKIHVGGASGYTVSQELLKLIRDGKSIKPDLVISYSGINDSGGWYYKDDHPFDRNRNNQIFEMIVRNNQSRIIRALQRLDVSNIPEGIQYQKSRAHHWFECECMMKGVCDELGIVFYGILQPWNQIGDQYSVEQVDEMRDFYEEARMLVDRKDYLWDFTSLFENNPDVFFDSCHVYEKGNIKLARKILPFVLSEIKKKKEIINR